MAKYLRWFNNHSDYEDYINGDDAIFPNVSWCDIEEDTHINKGYDAEIEYIANPNNGRCYIDTGIKGSGTQRIECVFMPIAKNNNEYNCVYGARTAAGSQHDGIYIYHTKSSSNYGYVAYNNTSNNNLSAAFASLNTQHTIIQNGGTFTLDGNTIKAYTTATFTCTNATIFIFDGNNNGTRGSYYGYFRLYSFKIFNDNILKRNFIPVRVGTTGYLYDSVTGRLFGNVGTGNFTLGNDI